MSLQSKILHLKLEAALALRHAQGWQKLIDLYGEARATEFYKHLGLNHLESKSVEWDGLTLSREPKEHEKIAVKGIAQAQESGKEAIGTILLNLRSELITDGLSGISQLPPSKYHELVLDIPAASRDDLRDRLMLVHAQGRRLVDAELGKKTASISNAPHRCHLTDDGLISACTCGRKAIDDGDGFDELDSLTDLTTSRIANDVQSRITAAASRFSLLGQSGPTLINSVTNEVTGGSVAYIDRAATGLANRVINIGREDEMQNRADEIDRYEQSALLDQNVCEPCASVDGQTASNPDELPGGPNPDCLGSDFCRCFVLAIAL